ncbi:MAG: EamA family transporter [Proteobacteria bacterium]|nr:EamA family transporter [Pseudomonadota bacterium]
MSFSASFSRPTLLGLGAILLWGLLAVLTTATEGIPPFQVTAMTFAIGGLAGLAIVATRGQLALLQQPPQAWALGIYGLFVYHAAYFSALKLAPPEEASMLNYLWPLLIVVFSAFLPGEKLAMRHIGGALLGLAGVAVLALGRGSLDFSSSYLAGYALALASAIIWSSYSVLSRRQSNVPTEAVAGFCLATAALAGIAHLLFETTVMPASLKAWGAIVLLGLGPVGAAFFLWDVGMKRGDIRFLGVASYATPIISTVALVLAGAAKPTPALGLACLLIVGGALVTRR